MAKKSTIDPSTEAKETKTTKSTKATSKTTSKKAPKAKEVNNTEVNEDIIVDESPEQSNGLVPENDVDINQIAELLQQIYSKKTVSGMSYREKKSTYGNTLTSADKLLRDASVRAKSIVDWTKEEYAELAKAAEPHSNHIKWVKVIGVEEDDKYGICMIARLMNKDPYVDRNRGQFKVRIPVSEFAAFDPTNPSFQGEKGYFYFKRELDNWVGNNVQVIFYDVNEKKRVAWASRLAASALLSKFYFRGSKPKFKKGQILTGQVMSAKRDRVTISVYGQDFNVRTDEATWTAALPLHEEFKIGQYVDVKILDVDNTFAWNVNKHNYELTKLVGSIKQASENPNEVYYNDFEIEGKYVGQVKSSTADGLKVFVVVANKILVMCDAPLIGTLGDQVYLQITKKDDKDKLFWGKIIKSSI